MLVQKAKLRTAFRKIAIISEEVASYELGGDNPAVSVDDLHRAIERMYQVSITLEEVVVHTKQFRSAVLRFSNRSARVLVRAGLDLRERRYFVVKELAHIALDEPEDWNPDPIPTIDTLVEIGVLGIEADVGRRHTPSIISEHVNSVVAVEFLYPFMWRAEDAKAVKEGRITWERLGDKYELPIRAIRLAHSAEYKQTRRTALNLS